MSNSYFDDEDVNFDISSYILRIDDSDENGEWFEDESYDDLVKLVGEL